jgi:hypothetical protein
MFARYMEEQSPGGSEIGHTDDFVCQECTRWSGLGAIDILAGVLDVSEDDRKAKSALVCGPCFGGKRSGEVKGEDVGSVTSHAVATYRAAHRR